MKGVGLILVGILPFWILAFEEDRIYNRDEVTINRIPEGHTLFYTGEADDITNGTSGGGDTLSFDINNKVKSFQLMDNWFAIGGRGLVSSAMLGDYITAELVAPASTHCTETSGDFLKVEIGSTGVYVFVPTTPGGGSWDCDLTAKLNANVSIHKATPIPNPTKTGLYSYDPNTDVISACASATCEYDLLDTDVVMFTMARKMWLPISGSVELKTDGIPAKRILKHWQLRFSYTTTSAAFKSYLTLETAVESN